MPTFGATHEKGRAARIVTSVFNTMENPENVFEA